MIDYVTHGPGDMDRDGIGSVVSLRFSGTRPYRILAVAGLCDAIGANQRCFLDFIFETNGIVSPLLTVPSTHTPIATDCHVSFGLGCAPTEPQLITIDPVSGAATHGGEDGIMCGTLPDIWWEIPLLVRLRSNNTSGGIIGASIVWQELVGDYRGTPRVRKSLTRQPT